MTGPVDSSPVTGFVLEDRDGTPLLTLTVPGVVVRLLAVTPIVVAIAVLHRVAPDVHWWPSLALVVLAIGSAGLPDSILGLVTLGGLAAWWLVAVQDPAVPGTLVVAGCGLVFHVALAHAAAGPSGFGPTRAAVRRLTARCAALLLFTGGVAAVVEVADEWDDSPALVVAATLALVGTLPWLAARRHRPGSG